MIQKIFYTTTSSTNPNTVFGFGTWTAFGAGKVLVGLNSGDTDFDTVEDLQQVNFRSVCERLIEEVLQ